MAIEGSSCNKFVYVQGLEEGREGGGRSLGGDPGRIIWKEIKEVARVNASDSFAGSGIDISNKEQVEGAIYHTKKKNKVNVIRISVLYIYL